jgi:hypothetical protein
MKERRGAFPSQLSGLWIVCVGSVFFEEPMSSPRVDMEGNLSARRTQLRLYSANRFFRLILIFFSEVP